MTKDKEEGCCGTKGSEGPCCSGKKMLVGLIVGALIFAAGMLFAKSCPLSQNFCPFSGPHMQQK